MSLFRNAASVFSRTVFGRILPPSPVHPLLSQDARLLSCLTSPITNPFLPNMFQSGGVRSITRNHFPRPKETKRIRRHGWLKRLSTEAGRKIIMKRILKGKYILSH